MSGGQKSLKSGFPLPPQKESPGNQGGQKVGGSAPPIYSLLNHVFQKLHTYILVYHYSIRLLSLQNLENLNEMITPISDHHNLPLRPTIQRQPLFVFRYVTPTLFPEVLRSDTLRNRIGSLKTNDKNGCQKDLENMPTPNWHVAERISE